MVRGQGGGEHTQEDENMLRKIILPPNSPLGVAFEVVDDFRFYKSGVYTSDTCKSGPLDVNHAVVMVGYGTDEDTGLDYFLIRNSWKPTWAEHGYIRLLRTDPDSLDDPDTNCGMDTKPQDGTGCKGDTDPVKVCGTSAILFDNLIPLGGHLLQ